MNLYIIRQNKNRNYDTYDSAVVAAETEEAARQINPAGSDSWGDAWADSPEHVTTELIGTTIDGYEAGIVLGSFNAG